MPRAPKQPKPFFTTKARFEPTGATERIIVRENKFKHVGRPREVPKPKSSRVVTRPLTLLERMEYVVEAQEDKERHEKVQDLMRQRRLLDRISTKQAPPPSTSTSATSINPLQKIVSDEAWEQIAKANTTDEVQKILEEHKKIPKQKILKTSITLRRDQYDTKVAATQERLKTWINEVDKLGFCDQDSEIELMHSRVCTMILVIDKKWKQGLANPEELDGLAWKWLKKDCLRIKKKKIVLPTHSTKPEDILETGQHLLDAFSKFEYFKV